jgi:glycosyltransferase involved in cell wall biosynthesis
VDVLHDIEKELSLPLFRGMPLGPVLNDVCAIELLNGNGKWGTAARWKDRARTLKHFLRPRANLLALPPLAPGRILVTWLIDNFRASELVHPVLEELGPERCVVLCGIPQVLPLVPPEAQVVSWEQAIHFDVAAWRNDYRRCRAAWQRRLRELCGKHHLPRGADGRLAFHLLVASQDVAGCLEFLRAARPAVVLTEYDRNSNWSCVVLAARLLAIPTFTMVHGVVNERAVGYVPFLADKVFCWGEIQRRQFLTAGERRAELLVAGCPRLTRELGVTRATARQRLGLDAEQPVIVLGTTPIDEQGRRRLAEVFCAAAGKLPTVSAVVRLHPSERLEQYAPVAKCYPAVRFQENRAATLDEILAAADIVVVPNSGFGSDALVKRRLAVVLDLPGLPLGHGGDLIEQGGCPRARDAEELAAVIDRLLTDEGERRHRFALAERYLEQFCAFFGRDSARRIAAFVTDSLPSRSLNSLSTGANLSGYR